MRTIAIALLLPITAFCRVERFTARGPSMLPVLPEFSVQEVDTSPEAFDRIQLGSVVVFRDPSSQYGNTSHYVFEKRAPGVWWTKGANRHTNRMPDKVYVTRENFVGLMLNVSVPIKSKRK
jgi:hypothetical protein